MVLFALACLGQEARADSILVAVGDDTNRQIIRPRVEAVLLKHKLDVRMPETSIGLDQALVQIAACADRKDLDIECARNVLDAVAIDQLLFVKTRRATDDTGQLLVRVEVTLLEARTGKVRTERGECVDCSGKPELGNVVESVVGKLVDTRARLVIECNVPDAVVTINGQAIGAAGKTYRIAAGKYELVIARDGYRPQTQTIEVAPEETKEFSITLLPATTDSGGDGKGQRFGPWKWASLAGGITFLGLGVTGIALDGKDVPGSLKTEHQFTTLGHGLAVSALGAAAIGAAVYMIIEDNRAERERLVQIRLFDKGAGIGLSGTF